MKSSHIRRARFSSGFEISFKHLHNPIEACPSSIPIKSPQNHYKIKSKSYEIKAQCQTNHHHHQARLRDQRRHLRRPRQPRHRPHLRQDRIDREELRDQRLVRQLPTK